MDAGQARVSGVLPVLGGVAVGLPVLDPHAHGEGLGLHGHAPGAEHRKGVPGGVAGAEDQLPAGQGIGAIRPVHGDAGQGAAPDVQVGEAAPKPDVRPQLQQAPAQIHQGDVEVVRAHMGLGVDEDVLRSAAGDQRL